MKASKTYNELPCDPKTLDIKKSSHKNKLKTWIKQKYNINCNSTNCYSIYKFVKYCYQHI